MTSELIRKYVETLPEMLDSGAVPIMPGVILSDGLELIMFGICPPEMMAYVDQRCKIGDVVEFAIGVDTYTKPEQGTTMDSAVIIFHARRGEATRIGVWEYEDDRCKPVVEWANAFWCERYAQLAKRMARWVAGDTGDRGKRNG